MNLLNVITEGISLVLKGKTPAVPDATSKLAIRKTSEIVFTDEEKASLQKIAERLKRLS